jgi:hypothetical protein
MLLLRNVGTCGLQKKKSHTKSIMNFRKKSLDAELADVENLASDEEALRTL